MTLSFDPACKGRYVFIKHQVLDHLPEKDTLRVTSGLLLAQEDSGKNVKNKAENSEES